MERNLRSKGMYAKVKRLVVRRKNYSRLGNQGNQGPYAFHVGPKLKVFRFSKTSNSRAITLGQGIGGASRPTAQPTILERLRNKYTRLITSAASKASSTSIVHVAKPKVVAPRFNLGFGVQRGPSVEDIGFRLSKHEQKYLDHMRRSVAECRNGYNLGLRL